MRLPVSLSVLVLTLLVVMQEGTTDLAVEFDVEIVSKPLKFCPVKAHEGTIMVYDAIGRILKTGDIFESR